MFGVGFVGGWSVAGGFVVGWRLVRCCGFGEVVGQYLVVVLVVLVVFLRSGEEGGGVVLEGWGG